MNRHEREFLLKYAEEAFVFLEAAGASLAVSETAYWTTLIYTLPRFHVDIVLDWREEIAEVLIRKPGPDCGNEGYYICGGQVIRHHLDEAFILTGIVTSGRSNKGGPRHRAPEVVQSMRLRLQEDAGRLSGCLSELTARSELLFPLADVVDEWQ